MLNNKKFEDEEEICITTLQRYALRTKGLHSGREHTAKYSHDTFRRRGERKGGYHLGKFVAIKIDRTVQRSVYFANINELFDDGYNYKRAFFNQPQLAIYLISH